MHNTIGGMKPQEIAGIYRYRDGQKAWNHANALLNKIQKKHNKNYN